MPSPEIPLTVEWNPWFQAAVGLALRVFLPGIAWGWALPAAQAEGRGRFFPHLRAGAFAGYIGLIVCLAVVISLGEAGCYRPGFEWAAIGMVSALGFGLGLWRDRASLARNLRLSLPVAALFAAGVAAVMVLPRQGEWIVGGWDPGTYVDEGVFASRQGTFRPGPDPLYSSIPAADWPAFVPRVLNFAEGLPVFPIDPDTRRFEFFFFRGMPAAVAMADRCGGLRAATRINMILGVLAFLMIAHAFWSWFGRRSHRWFALALVAAQPLWLYHLHFPTSELLQQTLWFGLFGVAAARSESRSAGAVLALGCFALIVTHLSLTIFVGLLLAAFAWCDLQRADRAAVRRERAWQIAAVLAGVGVDLLTSPTTVGRLDFILVRLMGLAAVFMLAAVIIDWLGGDDSAREAKAEALGSSAVWLALAGAAAVVAGGALAPGHFPWPRYNMKMILPYVTPGLAILAAVGVTLFVSARRDVSREAKAAVFLMIAVGVACLVESAIASLYPWATRRYVALGVPLLAILAGGVLAWLWEAPSRWMRPAAAVVFAAALVSLSLWSWPAFATTEYDGLSAKLAALAGRVGPRDVVLVDQFKYGVPLRFLHGRHVLNGERLADLSSASELEQVLRGLSNLRRAGWNVRLLTTTSRGLEDFPIDPAGARQDWAGEPFVVEEIEHSESVSGYNVRPLPVRFALYSWDPDAAAVAGFATNSLVEMDVGSQSDVTGLLGGFHGRETLPSGLTVRWTTGAGVVALRGEWEAGARVEVDYVEKYCPGGAATGGVGLVWDDTPLAAEAAVPVGGEVRRITARLPVAERGIHRLRITSGAWSPRTALGAADARMLGVMVDRVRVVPERGVRNVERGTPENVERPTLK